MARIIVDSRETRSGLALLLAARGAEVVGEELEIGDYVLTEGLCVERKEATDFVNSIMDRRIFAQVAIMKTTFARSFVLIEGDIFGTRSAISEDALLGAMSYISVIENVPILTTKSTAQTAALLLTMQRHAIEGLGYDVALRGAKPKDRKVQASYLLEGLPGVGPTAAKKLLAHFGSVHAVVSATVEDLRKCPGIGPKTAQAIQEVMHFAT
ncbi:ERCC4 domain-containing protein [Variovorax sp. LT1P1]|uniref:ERCC4 domain-containing protein n=1 Tax=Variovorax sp. LT1P1 TaxID=3443730 RepID=UPI003F447879